MAKPEDDFVALLGDVALNIDVWNCPEQIARRRAFASDNTYPRQLDRIASVLGAQGALIS